jgi:pyruvate/2-oxoglutarate/acetoin dehydrogenase E1 component
MRELTYAQAINEGIREEMRREPRMMVLGEDVGKYGGVFGVTRGLFDEFGGERVRDCPLNEFAIVGFAVGLAISGRPTLAELEFMDFITYAMDPVVNQAAKLRYFWGGQVQVPLVLRTPIAAHMGFGSQHSQSLEAWFMHVPGIKVVMPSTPYDAKGLIKTALRDPNPVLFAESIGLYRSKGDVPAEEYALPFGKVDVKRAGKDVTVVALGAMVQEALAAANTLAERGIEVEVIDPLSLAPLDIDGIVASVKKTNRLVVAHQAHKVGGAGAEIAQQVSERAFDYLDGPVQRVGAAHVPAAASMALEDKLYPNAADIVNACLSFGL